MGCCSSKMDDSGSESGGPSSPPRQARDNGSGYGGDGHKSIHSDTASPSVRDAETAAIAAGVAHTLAQDSLPEGEAAPRPPSSHSLPNEPYLLPPTVFEPQQIDAEVDASITTSVKSKEGDKKSKNKEKKKNKKKSSSSSSSSSSSGAKSD